MTRRATSPRQSTAYALAISDLSAILARRGVLRPVSQFEITAAAKLLRDNPRLVIASLNMSCAFLALGSDCADSGERSEAAAAGGAVESIIPDGNHGGYSSGAQTHD